MIAEKTAKILGGTFLLHLVYIYSSTNDSNDNNNRALVNY